MFNDTKQIMLYLKLDNESKKALASFFKKE